MTKVGTSIPTADELRKQCPLICGSLNALIRGDSSDIASHLIRVDSDIPIENTEIQSHCFFISSDANGRPRVGSLARLICTATLDYAIPRDEIEQAKVEMENSGSSMRFLALVKESKELFTDILNTGEGGELILFLFAEQILKLPQIIAKMSLKTSEKLHYNGSDGIHASVGEGGVLRLHWGESKLYADVKQAIYKCFKSLSPYLKEPFSSTAAQKNDIRLLQKHVKLKSEHKEIATSLKKYLNPLDPCFNKVEHCGLALVGYDSDAYPKEENLEDVNKMVSNAIKQSLVDLRKYTKSRAIQEKIHTYHINLFFLPFPDVEVFRKCFLNELGFSIND